MAILWAQGWDQLWYNAENGAYGEWHQLSLPEPSVDIEGIYGPDNVSKLYTAAEEIGVCAYDGTVGSWSIDYATNGDGPWPYGNHPESISLWCSVDDSLVVATGFGDNNDQIVARQGVPGTGWGIEFVGSEEAHWITPFMVHGTTDGNHVFAIAVDEDNYDAVLYKRTPGAGLSSSLLLETDIDSDGEDVTTSFITTGEEQLVVTVRIDARKGAWGGASFYLKKGSPPTTSDYDYSLGVDTDQESVVIPSPGSGTWYVLVHCWDAWWPTSAPSEGYEGLRINATEYSGLGTWTEVTRRSSASYYTQWCKLQVVSATEVYIAGKDETAGYDETPCIWKWDGTTLTKIFTGPSGWYKGRIYEEHIGLWVARDGSEGWMVVNANDPGSNYDKYVRFNGSTWSVFQECELGRYPHSIAQIAGDTTSACSGHGYGNWNIFTSGAWANDYYFGWPSAERKIWPLDNSPALELLYLDQPEPVTIPPDEVGPTVTVSPALTIGIGFPVDVTFVLDATDAYTGVDPSKTVIKLYPVIYDGQWWVYKYGEATVAWENGSPQTGFSQSTVQEIVDVENPGWKYTIVPDEDLEYSTNYVLCYYFEDFAGNITGSSYSGLSFKTRDELPLDFPHASTVYFFGQTRGDILNNLGDVDYNPVVYQLKDGVLTKVYEVEQRVSYGLAPVLGDGSQDDTAKGSFKGTFFNPKTGYTFAVWETRIKGNRSSWTYTFSRRGILIIDPDGNFTENREFDSFTTWRGQVIGHPDDHQQAVIYGTDENFILCGTTHYTSIPPFYGMGAPHQGKNNLIARWSMSEDTGENEPDVSGHTWKNTLYDVSTISGGSESRGSIFPPDAAPPPGPEPWAWETERACPSDWKARDISYSSSGYRMFQFDHKHDDAPEPGLWEPYESKFSGLNELTASIWFRLNAYPHSYMGGRRVLLSKQLDSLYSSFQIFLEPYPNPPPGMDITAYTVAGASVKLTTGETIYLATYYDYGWEADEPGLVFYYKTNTVQWHNLTLTVQKNISGEFTWYTAKLYKDGSLVLQGSSSFETEDVSIAIDESPGFIGGYPTIENRSPDGCYVADVAIYSEVKSHSWIFNEAVNYFGNPAKGLAVWNGASWSFDDKAYTYNTYLANGENETGYLIGYATPGGRTIVPLFSPNNDETVVFTASLLSNQLRQYTLNDGEKGISNIATDTYGGYGFVTYTEDTRDSAILSYGNYTSQQGLESLHFRIHDYFENTIDEGLPTVWPDYRERIKKVSRHSISPDLDNIYGLSSDGRFIKMKWQDKVSDVLYDGDLALTNLLKLNSAEAIAQQTENPPSIWWTKENKTEFETWNLAGPIYDMDPDWDYYDTYYPDRIGIMSVIFALDPDPDIPIVQIPSRIPPKLFWNQFDELGNLVSLPRKKGERNWEYKRRIQDAVVNRSNSTYRGLINTLVRELDLPRYYPVLISPKLKSDGSYFAPDPNVVIENGFVYLYSNFGKGLLANKIDRYEPGGNFECLGNLVDFINTSLYFEAHLLDGVDPKTRSMVLINQTSTVIVDSERVPDSSKYKLGHTRVSPGSLYFDNRTSYNREVSTESGLTRSGDYHVDYTKGIVSCYNIPIKTKARYRYTKYPFKPVACPVIIWDTTLDSFKQKFFEQVLQDDGTYANSLPTVKGVDLISELLTKYPNYFGE